MTDKISKEVAELEFNRFVEAMDIDADQSSMDDDDKAGFEQQKSRFIRAVMNGSLVLNDNDEPVFTPKRSECNPLTFREPTGASLMAMDGKKKGEDTKKLYALMADMTGVHLNTFSKMQMADMKVCMAIVTLFMG